MALDVPGVFTFMEHRADNPTVTCTFTSTCPGRPPNTPVVVSHNFSKLRVVLGNMHSAGVFFVLRRFVCVETEDSSGSYLGRNFLTPSVLIRAGTRGRRAAVAFSVAWQPRASHRCTCWFQLPNNQLTKEYLFCRGGNRAYHTDASAGFNSQTVDCAS